MFPVMFFPRFAAVEPQLFVMTLVEGIAGRYSSARMPMAAIVPVIDASTRIEIHVSLGIIVVVVVRPFAVRDPMNGASGGQHYQSCKQEAGPRPLQPCYHFCFH